MSVHICDRCGDVTLDGDGCTCTTPYNLSEVHQRHRTAVELARTTTRGRAYVESGEYLGTAGRTTASLVGSNSVTDTRAAAHSTAAAAVSGERAQARVPSPESMSSGSGQSSDG